MNTQLFRLLPFVLFTALVLIGCSRDDNAQQAQDYLKRADSYIAQNQYRAAMIEITNAMQSDPEDIRYPIAMAEVYNIVGASRRASDLLEDYRDDHPDEVALPLAEAYLQQGKFLSAEETLEGYTPQSEAEERELALYRADAQRIRGNLENSEEAFEALLEDYPDDREIKLRLAENHIFRDQTDQAERILDAMRESNPEDAEVWHMAAIAAWRQDDVERAEEYLTEALMYVPEADIMLPDRASILRLLSEALTAQGRTSEALVYQKVLAEDSQESMEAQRQLREATAAAEEGDYDKAETILEALLEENPDSQTAALMLGMVNMNRGDLDRAEPLLTRSVDVETATSDVIRATVLAQAEAGDADRALQTIERSLKVRPDDPVLLSIHGTLALSQPETEEEGYLSLQKALAQDPHRGNLRLVLARYHLRQDEPEQAMAQLRAGFNYQPADWTVTNVYMEQLFARDQLDEAAQALNTLKEAAPRERETALFDAQHTFRDGQPDEGIRQLRELLDNEPDYARGYGVLAQMHLNNDNPQDALVALEQLALLQPENIQVLRSGVDLVQRRELGVDPREWLRSLAERESALEPNTTALSAMLYRDAGDLERAVEVMQRYGGDATEYVRQVRSLVYRDRARELASNEQYEPAREWLAKALEAFPNSKTLNLDLVRLEMAEQRYEQADILLEDLRERHPDDAEVAVMRARFIRVTEGAQAAYRQLRADWNEQPDSEMAGLLLSLAREEAPDDVPDILQAWEEADPDNRGRLLFMAEEHQREGDEAGAIGAYERLLAGNPDDPVALNNLAWMLRERDLNRALTLAERAAEQQPESAPILDTYGWLLHLSGEREEAVRHLERAAELAPESQDIRNNLEAAQRDG